MNSEVVKMVRVMEGNPHKFIVLVYAPDGTLKVEYRSDDMPIVKWNDESRSLWLHSASYNGHPVIEWMTGMVLLCERNPAVPDK